MLQTEARGLSTTEGIVYAELFNTREEADEARKAANDRVRGKLGNVSIGSRRCSSVVELPVDTR